MKALVPKHFRVDRSNKYRALTVLLWLLLLLWVAVMVPLLYRLQPFSVLLVPIPPVLFIFAGKLEKTNKLLAQKADELARLSEASGILGQGITPAETEENLRRSLAVAVPRVPCAPVLSSGIPLFREKGSPLGSGGEGGGGASTHENGAGASIAIKSGETLLGTIQCRGRLTKEERILADTVANQAAVRLQNALLYETHVRLASILSQENSRLEAAFDNLAQVHKMEAMGLISMELVREIRAPLEEISKGAQGLSGIITDPEDRDCLRLVHEGVRRCLVIVEKMAHYTASDGEAAVPDSHQCRADVGSVLDSALRTLEARTRVQGITVVRSFDASLPPVEGDPSEYHQVFLNLLQNAHDALGGLPGGRIEVAVKVEAGHALVSFRDSGPGVPPEIRSRIFDPFFTTKDVGKGTGLGLSISLGLLKKNGADLELLSGHGNGAEFLVRIPISLPQDGKGPPS
ncbi:MAG: hypothetical protein HYU64_04040 [Armatimonadetes bacterium]|nr:hypothetical protein [Armatimonadota bacterium]